MHCAVPENIHTPPTEGIGISWRMGSSGRSKNIKKCMKLYWNFQRGGEVLEKKSLPLGRYGYFMELHILETGYLSFARCSGLMVSALDSGSSNPGFSPCLSHFTLTVSVSTQVYKWVPVTFNAGGNPAMD